MTSPRENAAPAPLHLAVALDGAGWHPAAWREPAARPAELVDGRYWTDLVQEAERGLLDLVTIEDSLALQSAAPGVPDQRTDQVRGRLDAVLTAARVGPLTSHIGLVPSATVTHTEPFHLSKAIATLDYVSTGRAGIRVQISGRADEAAHVGRRTLPTDRDALVRDLLAEADEYVEIVRRLWDSWEDDAEIRDAATGRFVDRDKLHYIDFDGNRLHVKGPSITPRPPQGQPLVTALAHVAPVYRFAARAADVVFVTPSDPASATAIVGEIRAAQDGAGRAGEPLHIFADLLVHLDADPGRAADRRAGLDERAGEPATSDATIVTGTPAELADLLLEWQRSGLTGFRLRPATIPGDLTSITRGLVPELQRRGAFRRSYPGGSLRDLLGLTRPANRYAA